MNDRPARAAGIGRAGVGDRPVRTGADVTASTAVRYALVPAPSRSGLCLNYASIGLVLELLDRISLLEAALRGRGTRSETHPWT